MAKKYISKNGQIFDGNMLLPLDAIEGPWSSIAEFEQWAENSLGVEDLSLLPDGTKIRIVSGNSFKEYYRLNNEWKELLPTANNTQDGIISSTDYKKLQDIITSTATYRGIIDLNKANSLTDVASIGVYYLSDDSYGMRGLLSVQTDFYNAVSQILLSSVTPVYNGDTMSTINDPAVIIRKYTNGSWSKWSKLNGDSTFSGRSLGNSGYELTVDDKTVTIPQASSNTAGVVGPSTINSINQISNNIVTMSSTIQQNTNTGQRNSQDIIQLQKDNNENKGAIQEIIQNVDNIEEHQIITRDTTDEEESFQEIITTNLQQIIEKTKELESVARSSEAASNNAMTYSDKVARLLEEFSTSEDINENVIGKVTKHDIILNSINYAIKKPVIQPTIKSVTKEDNFSIKIVLNDFSDGRLFIVKNDDGSNKYCKAQNFVKDGTIELIIPHDSVLAYDFETDTTVIEPYDTFVTSRIDRTNYIILLYNSLGTDGFGPLWNKIFAFKINDLYEHSQGDTTDVSDVVNSYWLKPSFQPYIESVIEKDYAVTITLRPNGDNLFFMKNSHGVSVYCRASDFLDTSKNKIIITIPHDNALVWDAVTNHAYVISYDTFASTMQGRVDFIVLYYNKLGLSGFGYLFDYIVDWRTRQNEVAIKNIGTSSSKLKSDITSTSRCGYTQTGYPFQSKQAFIEAANIGFDYLLGDLRFTSDGVMVLEHDDYINQYYPGVKYKNGTAISGAMYIANTTYSTLKTMNFARNSSKVSDCDICTLEDLFSVCKITGCSPIIELKTSVTIEQANNVINLAKVYGLYDKMWIAGDNATQLSVFAKKDSHLLLATPLFVSTYNDFLALKTNENNIHLAVRFPHISESGQAVPNINDYINSFIDNNVLVQIGTVNEKSVLDEWLSNNTNHNYLWNVRSDMFVAEKYLINKLNSML